MAIHNFEISATTAAANVETLTTTPNMAPKSEPLGYVDTVKMASGHSVDRGFPVAVWEWGFIPADLFNALRVICPGPSANVYIRTLSEDYSTYAYYTGIMNFPRKDTYEYRSGNRQPFRIEFTHLVSYTPST